MNSSEIDSRLYIGQFSVEVNAAEVFAGPQTGIKYPISLNTVISPIVMPDDGGARVANPRSSLVIAIS